MAEQTEQIQVSIVGQLQEVFKRLETLSGSQIGLTAEVAGLKAEVSSLVTNLQTVVNPQNGVLRTLSIQGARSDAKIESLERRLSLFQWVIGIGFGAAGTAIAFLAHKILTNG